jgi:ABC-type nitrate/sulfonate/bicarbonate transport system permease component
MKFLVPLLALISWQISASLMQVHYFPTPITALAALFEDFNNGELIKDLSSSAYRFTIGVSMGIATSIILGTIIGRFKLVKTLLMPSLDGLRAMPVVALFPLIIMLFGINEKTAIFIIAFVSFVPTLITTVDSIQDTFNKYLSLIRNLNLSFIESVRKILIPGSMPGILSGVDLSVNQAFKALILAELLGVHSGIGFRLAEAAEFLNYNKVYYLLTLIGVIGVLISFSFGRVRRFILRWS